MARKKGSTNKKTQFYREKVAVIFEKTIEEIKKGDDISKLTPRDRMDLFAKLVQYFVPKPVEGLDEAERHQANMESILASIAKKV